MATQRCPCGRAGDPSGVCTCAAPDIARYRARLSGPLADRIDLHVAVGAVPVRALAAVGAAPAAASSGDTSASVRSRVEAARGRQRERFDAWPTVRRKGRCNAHVAGRWLDAHTPVERAARELLASAAERLGLSARGYHRVLTVARTIADLDGAAAVNAAGVAEALRYRPVVPIPDVSQGERRPARTHAIS